MHAIKFSEGKAYKLYGNSYHLLLEREKTERIESELVEMRSGSKTPRHKHEDEEQLYIILEGKALLEINDDRKMVEPGMIVYIPRNHYHRITCAGEENLKYIYVACWPEGDVPPSKTEEELRAYEHRLVTNDQ
jgi:mannose-6-phosphate isomerase-like protein (cupin superfamily)